MKPEEAYGPLYNRWKSAATKGGPIVFGENSDRLRARLSDALDGWQKAVDYGTKRDRELETAKNEIMKIAAQVADCNTRLSEEKDKVARLRAVIFGRLRYERSKCGESSPIVVTRAEYDAIMEWRVMGARFIGPEPERLFFEGKALHVHEEAP